MKLICEELTDIQIITESKENGKKNVFIEGVFMQGDLKNRNGRIYSTNILENEINRYSNEYVNKKRAFGELGHPTGPTINLERVAIMIESLKKDGNNFIGRAKVMDTPYGNIVKNLIGEGACLGVSSRGMGSLKLNREGVNEVQNDFYLATAADVVADPSAPDAFVQGIMEGVEWIWDNGLIKAEKLDGYKNKIASTRSGNLEEAKLQVFESFLKNISRN